MCDNFIEMNVSNAISFLFHLWRHSRYFHHTNTHTGKGWSYLDLLHTHTNNHVRYNRISCCVCSFFKYFGSHQPSKLYEESLVQFIWFPDMPRKHPFNFQVQILAKKHPREWVRERHHIIFKINASHTHNVRGNGMSLRTKQNIEARYSHSWTRRLGTDRLNLYFKTHSIDSVCVCAYYGEVQGNWVKFLTIMQLKVCASPTPSRITTAINWRARPLLSCSTLMEISC